MYYERHAVVNIKDSEETFPSVLLTGPRQVGKSTLLTHIYPKMKNISLDTSALKTAALDDPAGFLQTYGNPLIIDEVQKVPELFEELKAVIDENRHNGMYLLTGSQSYRLMKYVSESLSGRISILMLLGLSTREIYGDKDDTPFIPTLKFLMTRKPTYKMTHQELWERIHRGSLPECWANKKISWEKFYDSYLQSYLDRDVRELSQVGDLNTFRKFMVSAAARTGQLLNMADIARDVGIDQTTVKRWLSILEASHLVVLVQPFSLNVTKRIIKAPKLYFTDTGLVCYLTRWKDAETLESGAMSGSIFETYVFGEILKSYINKSVEPDLYFFRDTNGSEIDFLIHENNTLYPIEVKKHSAPNKKDVRAFKSLQSFYPGMKIGEGCVVCTGTDLLPIEKDIKAVPVEWL